MARAMKVCSVTGCPELVPSGTSKCEAHRVAAQVAYEKTRPSASQRGYGGRWQKTRARHLAQSPFCVEPGCGVQATEVDHIDGEGPKGARGHDHDNLRSLCKTHHSRRTARDQGGWQRTRGGST